MCVHVYVCAMHPFTHASIHIHTYRRCNTCCLCLSFWTDGLRAEKAFPKDFQSSERFPVSGRFCSFHPIPSSTHPLSSISASTSSFLADENRDRPDSYGTFKSVGRNPTIEKSCDLQGKSSLKFLYFENCEATVFAL